MCGACFYKRSLIRPEAPATDDAPRSDAMWHRLAEAITALEAIAARIATEMNELVKSRDAQQNRDEWTSAPEGDGRDPRVR